MALAVLPIDLQTLEQPLPFSLLLGGHLRCVLLRNLLELGKLPGALGILLRARRLLGLHVHLEAVLDHRLEHGLRLRERSTLRHLGREHKRGVVSALALLDEAHRLQQANGALGWSELLLEGLGAPADASVLVLRWVLDDILYDGEERLGRELEDGRVLVEKQNTARASSSAAVAANEAAGGGGCGGCDDLGGITAEEKASGVRVERALSALGIYLVPRFPAT